MRREPRGWDPAVNRQRPEEMRSGAGYSSHFAPAGMVSDMTRRHRKRLDEVDLQLIDLLANNPRASQRALAKRVGVTDETVANRLRRLREDDVIATTAVIDWEHAGYGAGAIARLTVSRRSGVGLAEPLTELPGVQFAGLTTGCCDLIVSLLACDLGSLQRSIRDLAQLDDVLVSAVNVVTRSPIYDTSLFTLPLRPWTPEDLPHPDPTLDDLDHALIGELVLAGHESNRELGRRLGVSDGTVRARIRRLEEGGLLRLVAGRDPVATGELRAYAFVFVTLDGYDEKHELVKHPLVRSALEVIGDADLVLHVAAATDADLARFLTYDLRVISGVRDVSVAHIAEVIEHHTHLVRFD